VSGPDLTRLHAIAMQVAERVGANPLTRNVNFDWIEPARTMRIQIDRTRRGSSASARRTYRRR